MTPSNVRLFAALAFAPLIVLPACNASVSTGGADVSKLEKSITDELNRNYEKISQTVSSTSCPDLKDKPKPGDKFLCSAEVSGHKVRVEATVKDDDGNFHFETLDTLFDVRDTSDTLTKEVSKQVGSQVKVDCGSEKLIVVAEGSTFDCSAAGSRGSGTVVVTVKSDGGINWKLVDFR